MSKLNIKMNIISNEPHVSGVISGYVLLKKQNIINLKINKPNIDKSIYPHGCLVECIINEQVKVVYDLLDGYNLDFSKLDAYLENVDFYFKRSFCNEYNKNIKNKNKIYPLGMNYYVTTKGNPLDMTFKKILGKLVKSLLNKDVPNCYVENFESNPKSNIDNATVLYCTRLWSPFGEPGEGSLDEITAKERDFINNTRISIIKRLKLELGDKFIGGLYNSEYAREISPELILDDSITKKSNYMQLVKKADICIGSMGLYESTGWKTAEYIAASKAIVHENFRYDTVGDFSEGNNFLSFTTADECLDNVYKLINNPQNLLKIQQNNFTYYNNYLRPDMQVLNSLKTVICYSDLDDGIILKTTSI